MGIVKKGRKTNPIMTSTAAAISVIKKEKKFQ